ncbi:MAG: hypothetical protein GF405_02285 [Candidatus Eisenbacteria bacterium]|nr:hypothetical protein [Candidatus Eisenbacteria bacterium]
MKIGTRVGGWLAALAASAFLMASVVPWMTVAAGGAGPQEVFAAFGLTAAGLIWVFVSAFCFRRSGCAND